MKIHIPEYIDPKRYILTIYRYPDRFSFSLYDPAEAGSYLYHELTGEKTTDAFSIFKDAFFEYNFFSLPFRKTYILNRTPFFTYVPDSIYEDQYQEDFMQFLFSEKDGMTLAHTVPNTEMVVLHQLPEEMYHFFLRSFLKLEFIHYSSPLISYFQKESKNMMSRQMIVNITHQGVDIFCFSAGAFLLGNHFRCNRVAEVFYYILFVWKQLKFDPLKDHIRVIGNHPFNREIIEKLQLYVQWVVPVNIPSKTYFEQVDTLAVPFELAALSLYEL